MDNKNKIENVTERLNEILKERDISFREFYEEFNIDMGMVPYGFDLDAVMYKKKDPSLIELEKEVGNRNLPSYLINF